MWTAVIACLLPPQRRYNTQHGIAQTHGFLHVTARRDSVEVEAEDAVQAVSCKAGVQEGQVEACPMTCVGEGDEVEGEDAAQAMSCEGGMQEVKVEACPASAATNGEDAASWAIGSAGMVCCSVCWNVKQCNP